LCEQNVELLNINPGAILWGPLCLLCSGYRVSFPAVKRPGRGVDNPTQSSAEVKERVKLYRYYYSETAWPVLGRILPFFFTLNLVVRKVSSGL